MASPYRLLMFDFDGTLADSFPWLTGVIHKISEKYQLSPLSVQQLEALRGADSRDIMAQLGVPFWKLPQMAAYARQLASEDIDQIHLFAGMDNLLQKLSERSFTLAVVSSNAQENIKRVLGPQNTALMAYFECGAPLSGKQAHIKRLLKQSGVPAAQAMLIGDEVRDVEAAHQAGVAAGAVSWGYNRRDLLAMHHPTAIFSSPEDLLAQICES
ncbi:MAG: HAD hydrolase-like protein [Anaerolineae bacterium]|nr:HAD hydrolase-like protein [Anaerolineae bacterium]